jgi:hypothetical protein
MFKYKRNIFRRQLWIYLLCLAKSFELLKEIKKKQNENGFLYEMFDENMDEICCLETSYCYRFTFMLGSVPGFRYLFQNFFLLKKIPKFFLFRALAIATC